MTPLERAFHYAPFLELAAELGVGNPIPPEPAVSAWGTPVHLIDGNEYCLSCERDNREGHYENCLISPPRATL